MFDKKPGKFLTDWEGQEGVEAPVVISIEFGNSGQDKILPVADLKSLAVVPERYSTVSVPTSANARLYRPKELLWPFGSRHNQVLEQPF